MTSRWMPERLTGLRAGLARVAEAEAEGDVRGGVLVQQRREVRRGRPRRRARSCRRARARPGGLPRGRARGRRRGTRGRPRPRPRCESSRPRRNSPAMPSITRPASASGRVQRKTPVVAVGRRAREHLLGRDVRRDALATHVVDPAAPARACGQREMEVGAGRRQPDLAQVERGQARGALGEALRMPPPAVRRIVVAEAGEAAGGRRRARRRRRRGARSG